MRKQYLTPEMETVEMEAATSLLLEISGETGSSGTGSGEGDPEQALSHLLDDIVGDERMTDY